MIRPVLILIILLCIVPGPDVRAQVPLQELTSPYKKTSCADEVTAESILKKSDMVFTGRIVRKEGVDTWFWIYVVHKGDLKAHRTVKALGFDKATSYDNANGVSYDVGQVYTVAVRQPNKAESSAQGGKFYANALQSCEGSVFSTAHTRYGPLRVTRDKFVDSPWEGIRSGLIDWLTVIFLIGLAGASWAKRREIIDLINEKLKKEDSE